MRRRQTEILSCAWDLSVSPESFSLAPAFFGEQAAHAQHKTVSGTGAQKIHCDTGNNGQTPDLYRSMFCPTKLQVQSLSIVQGFHKSFSFVLMNIAFPWIIERSEREHCHLLISEEMKILGLPSNQNSEITESKLYGFTFSGSLTRPSVVYFSIVCVERKQLQANSGVKNELEKKFQSFFFDL